MQYGWLRDKKRGRYRHTQMTMWRQGIPISKPRREVWEETNPADTLCPISRVQICGKINTSCLITQCVLISVLTNSASYDPYLAFMVWMPTSFVCWEVTLKREQLRPSPVLVETTTIFCLSTADSTGCQALLVESLPQVLQRSHVTWCAVFTCNTTGAGEL